MSKKPSYNMQRISLKVARPLIEQYHGYASVGNNATYAFGVYEGLRLVAAYVWQPPPPGAAISVCQELPQAVLSLSRMVAVPKPERQLNHVSKPLRRQMQSEIDRGRWPVLITYSDEGQGHTGHVYKCSGWKRTKRSRRPVYKTLDGRRASPYSNGRYGKRGLRRTNYTHVQRWEHWACEPGIVCEHMERSGWFRVAVPGRVWRSGNQAFTFVRRKDDEAVMESDGDE